jgi:hypothetical protein
MPPDDDGSVQRRTGYYDGRNLNAIHPETAITDSPDVTPCIHEPLGPWLDVPR